MALVQQIFWQVHEIFWHQIFWLVSWAILLSAKRTNTQTNEKAQPPWRGSLGKIIILKFCWWPALPLTYCSSFKRVLNVIKLTLGSHIFRTACLFCFTITIQSGMHCFIAHIKRKLFNVHSLVILLWMFNHTCNYCNSQSLCIITSNDR